MLKLFEVTGFKNFKDKITLDLSDVRDYSFNQNCISDQFVGKMIVYGQNSVGKSNLGLAVFDIVSHLTSKNVTPHMYDYYLNVENTDGYATFRYVFSFGENEIDYSYRKNEKRDLLYERLTMDQELVFEYDYQEKKGNTEGLHQLTPTINLSMKDVDSILRYVISNTVLDEKHPLRQMMTYVGNMLWFRNLDQNRFIGYKMGALDYLDFIFDEKTLREFESFLHSAGIKENLAVKTGFDGKQHLCFDTNPPLPFNDVASNGTKALYTFFYWYKTAKDVSLLFIDEFDAFYHYELAESIVGLLEKMSNTQVILTSHNTNLLTNKIMRPDCYFILTHDGLTSFANATQRELREGHNLEKLYMSGEFGG